MLENMKQVYEDMSNQLKSDSPKELVEKKSELLKIISKKPTSLNRKKRLEAKIELEELEEELQEFEQCQAQKNQSLDMLEVFNTASKLDSKYETPAQQRLLDYLEQVQETLPVLKRLADNELRMFRDEYDKLIEEMRSLTIKAGYTLSPFDLQKSIHVGYDWRVSSKLDSIKNKTLSYKASTYEAPEKMFQEFPDDGYVLVAGSLVITEHRKYARYLKNKNK